MMLHLLRLALAVLLVSAATMCAPTGSVPAPRVERPTLVLFVTVDQLHPDYLRRYRSELHGGLARLLDGGAVFTQAFQDHAITETAPGHASTMSGRFPKHTGITRNILGVNDPQWTLIGTDELGASPSRFQGTTLTDWLTAVDSGTRAFSVSMKDRGAILPIGRSRQQVYWFAMQGFFTTSIWYADTLPTWVRRFNQRDIARRMAGRSWNLLLPESRYAEPDSSPYEFFGRNTTFPHEYPSDSSRAALIFRITPMMDELTVDFALEGFDQLQIGRGPSTDVMAVSLSATDGVGHYWGPESREIHDQILRLDRQLGRLIEEVFRRVDSTRVLIALTADHGVGPIPELHGKLRVRLGPAVAAARTAVAAAGGDSSAVDVESGALFLPDSGWSAGAEAFVAAARAIPGVLRVDRFADLKRRDLAHDKIARRWLNMFPPEIEPAVVVTLDEGNVYDYPVVATHGSPHDYDAHVPMIFYGPAFRTGRYDEFARVIDMGPTLARALGVEPTEPIDGQPLNSALR
ncbi:MAG: alkaline phosphatase family protein [Gemmatimonadales bacterium]